MRGGDEVRKYSRKEGRKEGKKERMTEGMRDGVDRAFSYQGSFIPRSD
jgi:hypothetical protein